MAERLAPLRATQGARVRSLARTDLRFVLKMAFSFTPSPGARSQALQLKIINSLTFAVAKAKVFPHLEAWVPVKRGIPHAKDVISLSALSYSKE
jgi:1-deoxy-D-xylulose 5-phosphate reductoisomerase